MFWFSFVWVKSAPPAVGLLPGRGRYFHRGSPSLWGEKKEQRESPRRETGRRRRNQPTMTSSRRLCKVRKANLVLYSTKRTLKTACNVSGRVHARVRAEKTPSAGGVRRNDGIMTAGGRWQGGRGGRRAGRPPLRASTWSRGGLRESAHAGGNMGKTPEQQARSPVTSHPSWAGR